jgi:hypothetical protein
MFTYEHNSDSIAYKNIVEIFGRDSYIIYVSGSFGDIYLNLSLMSDFRKMIVGDIGLILPDRYSEMYKYFDLRGLKILVLNPNDFNFLNTLVRSNMHNGYYIKKGMIYPTLPSFHRMIIEFYNTGRIKGYDLYTGILNLPIDSSFKNLTLTGPENELAKLHIVNNGCRLGKTFVVSHYNNSHINQDINFWSNICHMLVESGYDVLVNSTPLHIKGESPLLSNYPKTTLPPHLCLQIIKEAGFSISGTNGLCTLLSVFGQNVKTIQIINEYINQNEHNSFSSPYHKNSCSHLLNYEACINKSNWLEISIDDNLLEDKIKNFIKYDTA